MYKLRYSIPFIIIWGCSWLSLIFLRYNDVRILGDLLFLVLSALSIGITSRRGYAEVVRFKHILHLIIAVTVLVLLIVLSKHFDIDTEYARYRIYIVMAIALIVVWSCIIMIKRAIRIRRFRIA
jgi:hypothetical protein